MNLKKISITFSTIVALAVIVLVIFDGYWPAFLVNSSPVSYRRFQEAYESSMYYYRINLKASGQDEMVLKSDEVQKEIRRSVLESLVEQKLIENELSKRLSGANMSEMVNEKINAQDVDSENFKNGTRLLYGLSAEEFTKIILVPQAQREILEGRFILDSSAGGFEEWLKNQKKKTSVYSFMSGFYWKDGEMKIK